MQEVGLTKDVCDGLGKHIPATVAASGVIQRPDVAVVFSLCDT